MMDEYTKIYCWGCLALVDVMILCKANGPGSLIHRVEGDGEDQVAAPQRIDDQSISAAMLTSSWTFDSAKYVRSI